MPWPVAWWQCRHAHAPFWAGMCEPAEGGTYAMSTLRPAAVCRHLLATLDASEGRRKRRKRNTTPDAIGLTMRRHLLEGTIQDDPDPIAFESWLLQRCQAVGLAAGPMRA